MYPACSTGDPYPQDGRPEYQSTPISNRRTAVPITSHPNHLGNNNFGSAFTSSQVPYRISPTKHKRTKNDPVLCTFVNRLETHARKKEITTRKIPSNTNCRYARRLPESLVSLLKRFHQVNFLSRIIVQQVEYQSRFVQHDPPRYIAWQFLWRFPPIHSAVLDYSSNF